MRKRRLFAGALACAMALSITPAVCANEGTGYYEVGSDSVVITPDLLPSTPENENGTEHEEREETPDPSPVPTPDGEQDVTPDPSPAPTPDEEQEATPDPSPTPTPDEEQEATPDPSPAPTPDEEQDVTPDPSPAPTPDEEQDVTPDPSPVPAPEEEQEELPVPEELPLPEEEEILPEVVALETPILSVNLPTNVTIIINPYQMQIPTAEGVRQDTIIDTTHIMVSNSNVPLRVNVRAVAQSRSGITFVRELRNRFVEDKAVHLYAEFHAIPDENTEVDWVGAYCDMENQLLIQEEETEKLGVMTLAAGNETPAYGAIRLFGEASCPSDVVWEKIDSLSVDMVFTFDVL